MKKQLFKSATITLTFYVLVVSAFTVICFADYPGPDTDSDDARGLLEGVTSFAQGAYHTGIYNMYEDVYHWATRWAIGPSSFIGNLKVSFWTSEYENMDIEVEEDYAGGPGYGIWATYVASWAYSEFTNDWSGGWWTRSCESMVTANP